MMADDTSDVTLSVAVSDGAVTQLHALASLNKICLTLVDTARRNMEMEDVCFFAEPRWTYALIMT